MDGSRRASEDNVFLRMRSTLKSLVMKPSLIASAAEHARRLSEQEVLDATKILYDTERFAKHVISLGKFTLSDHLQDKYVQEFNRLNLLFPVNLANGKTNEPCKWVFNGDKQPNLHGANYLLRQKLVREINGVTQSRNRQTSSTTAV